MKKIYYLLFCFVFIAWGGPCAAQPNFAKQGPTLDSYIPKTLPDGKGGEVAISANYDSAIPTPKQVLGFELGTRFVEWADVLNYMQALDAASDRVSIEEAGLTYENRRFIRVIITSAGNQQKLTQIRNEHLKLADTSISKTLDIAKMPLIMTIGGSLHGGEASGANSTLVTAYFLAASQDATIKKMLENVVLVLTPGQNPDGINRFATWHNTTGSYGNISDNNLREHKEPWPSSRLNHYWADCNRDLLMCHHPEGRVAVETANNWMPNVQIDLHEQGGAGARFYHSPGAPGRIHPCLPKENYPLTQVIGKYVELQLTPIPEAKPWSGRGYDKHYLGKGAAYGDLLGAIGMLFEQANPKGFSREVKWGTLTLEMGIRNQTNGCLAAMYGSHLAHTKLMEYQREFFLKNADDINKSKIKGYVFDTRGRRAIAWHFIDLMKKHQINIYRLKQTVKENGMTFNSEDAYVIPFETKTYCKLKGLWDDVTEFEEKRVYDISTWSFPRAFDLRHAALTDLNDLVGEKADPKFPEGKVIGEKTAKTYVVEARELYSYNMLSALLQNNVQVTLANKNFTVGGKKFACGSAIVATENQPIGNEKIYNILTNAARVNGVDVYAVNENVNVDKVAGTSVVLPKIALMIGNGIASSASGEIWNMLERRYGLYPARIDISRLGSIKDLDKYNVMIIASGDIPSSGKAASKLKSWVEQGGRLILTGNSYRIANRTKLTSIRTGAGPISKEHAEKVKGVILQSELDTTNPLGYGYEHNHIPLFKNGTRCFDLSQNSEAIIPLRYTDKPYLSGCISQNNLDRFAGTPAACVVKCGDGQVIYFADNLNFRSFWYATTKIFMNAVYFGGLPN